MARERSDGARRRALVALAAVLATLVVREAWREARKAPERPIAHDARFAALEGAVGRERLLGYVSLDTDAPDDAERATVDRIRFQYVFAPVVLVPGRLDARLLAVRSRDPARVEAFAATAGRRVLARTADGFTILDRLP